MFTFRLARALGMTRRQLIDQVDSAELTEWAAFDRLEPLDVARRIETSVGMNTAKHANLWRGEGDEPLKTSDFMPVWGAELRSELTTGADAEEFWHRLEAGAISAAHVRR